LSGPPVISPDGKMVVMSLGANARAALWSRRLDSDRFEKLAGTEGAGSQPFWSPDGAQIAFFATGKLKKVKLPHGTPEDICDLETESARGGAWSSKGVILFGVNYKGLMKVPETGGEPVMVAGLDEHLKENSLRFPQFLLDGNRFVYFSRTLDPRNHAIYIDALDSVGKVARRKLAVADGAPAIGHDSLADRDYLLFPNDGQLWAQRLDQASGSLLGEKLAVSDDVGQFSLSRTGTLVFRRAASERSTLKWVDPAGKIQAQLGQPGDYWDVSLSPDERHAAVLNHRSADGRFWVETIDLASNVQTALSDPAGRSAGLVWAHDSASVYFGMWGDSQNRTLVRHLDSAEPPQVAWLTPDRYDIRSSTPDGKILVADRWSGNTRRGLVFSPPGPSPWRVFEEPSVIFEKAQFSPDGRWVAYEAIEGRVAEIYISDFPRLSSRKRISPAGGAQPRWSRDGKQLFYLSANGFLMSAKLVDSSSPAFSSPEALFRDPAQVADVGGFSYDVSRDGKRFLLTNRTPPVEARDLSIVFNWPQLIGEKGQSGQGGQ
jgi:Tol biopolymer transport system component